MAHVLTPNSSTRAVRKAGVAGNAGLERLGWAVVSLACLGLIWELAAATIGSRHFPGPALVFNVLMREAQTGALWHHLSITLLRVLGAFVIAMILGGVIGLAVGSFKIADQFFDSWLTLFLNLPALVIIALCYVWFGTTEATAVAAVAISKIPNVAIQMREGARGLSKDLSEMARVYNFGPWKTLRHVVLPQLAPFWAAAARSGLALVWKIVLVVEALGGHSTGVGHQIHTAFGSYDVPVILAYALAFIVVIQIVELGFLQPLQARVNRWRR